MYSVVLMMALTGGGDAPAFGGCRGGCHGCSGGCYGSCHGGRRQHGCHGGCHGCQGGCHGGRRQHGCCGCCGGCYGGGYGGCYGGCYGGGMGGCYGGGMGGCYGGGMGGFGGMGGVVVPPVAPTAPTAPNKTKTSIDSSAPATLIVTVPADARLSIDGEATTSTTTQRVFVSPALNFGRQYSYTLQAEFTKNGKKVTVNKEVAVQAGEETRVNFDADNSAEIASR